MLETEAGHGADEGGAQLSSVPQDICLAEVHGRPEQEGQGPEQTQVDEDLRRRELSAEEVAAMTKRRREARAAVRQMEKEMAEIG